MQNSKDFHAKTKGAVLQLAQFAMIFTDFAAFLLISIPVTLLLTIEARGLFIILPIIIFKMWLAAEKAGTTAVKASALDVFKVLKIFSSLCALVIVNASQNGYQTSIHVVAAILGINMLEACVTDVMISRTYGWPNALCGLVLVITLFIEAARFPIGEAYPNPDGVFLYPLKLGWVLGYTSWNANFVYGVGFAWSFWLILITPLVVASLVNPYSWLGARTYSLVLNQVLRGANACWLFNPGKSFVTKEEGAPSGNNYVRFCVSVLNLLFVTVCFLEGYLF
jgi:hypothetical protein